MSQSVNFQNIDPVFQGCLFFKNPGLVKVVQELMEHPEENALDVIGNLNGRLITVEPQGIIDSLCVLFQQIIHLLKKTFSCDYHDRFKEAARKITQCVEEDLSRYSQLFEDQLPPILELSGLECLTEKLRLINEIPQKRHEEAEKKLGKLILLQNRYEEAKSTYEALPQGRLDKLKYYWGYVKPTQTHENFTAAKNHLLEVSNEIRSLYSLPRSENLYLTSEEKEKLQEEISQIKLDFNLEGTLQPLSKKQKMLNDMSSMGHPHLAKVWENLLGKFENEDIIKNWTVRTDGSFTIELTRPVYIWIQNPKFKGGAVVTIGNSDHMIEGKFVRDPSKIEKDHQDQIQKVIKKSNENRAQNNQKLREANPGVSDEELAGFEPSLSDPPDVKGMIFTNGLGSYVCVGGIWLDVSIVHMLHMGYEGEDDKTANIVVSAGNCLRWEGGIEKPPKIEQMWNEMGVALEFNTEKYPFLADNPKINIHNFYQYYLEHKKDEEEKAAAQAVHEASTAQAAQAV